MSRMTTTILIVLLMMLGHMSLPSGTSPVDEADAQQPTGDCTISMTPSTISIDVTPGSQGIGTAQVSVTNPTQFTEVIAIQVQASGLAFAAPGSITLEPFGETQFQLSIKSVQRAPYAALPGSVTCQVDYVNGVNNPVPVQKKTDFIISIKQFAFLRVSAEKPFQQLRPWVDFTLTFTIHNDGNFRDKFLLDVANRETLEKKGWSISLAAPTIEVEAQSQEQVLIQIRSPKKQGWSDDYYQIQFSVESQFSKDFESPDNPEGAEVWVTMYIRGIYLPGFELVGQLLPAILIALIAGVLLQRRYQPDSNRFE